MLSRTKTRCTSVYESKKGYSSKVSLSPKHDSLSAFLAKGHPMLGWIGYQELLIIMLIVLVLFGGSRLPSLMRNLGRSANEFKRGMRDEPEAETNNNTPNEEK